MMLSLHQDLHHTPEHLTTHRRKKRIECAHKVFICISETYNFLHESKFNTFNLNGRIRFWERKDGVRHLYTTKTAKNAGFSRSCNDSRLYVIFLSRKLTSLKLTRSDLNNEVYLLKFGGQCIKFRCLAELLLPIE